MMVDKNLSEEDIGWMVRVLGQSDAYRFQYNPDEENEKNDEIENDEIENDDKNEQNEQNEKNEETDRFTEWMLQTLPMFADRIDNQSLTFAVQVFPKSHFTADIRLICFPMNDASLICTDENDQTSDQKKIKRMAYALVWLFLRWWNYDSFLGGVKTNAAPCDRFEEELFTQSKMESSKILGKYLRSLKKCEIEIIEEFVNWSRGQKFADMTFQEKEILLSQLNLQNCVRVFTFLRSQFPQKVEGEKFRIRSPPERVPTHRIRRELSFDDQFYDLWFVEEPGESIELLSPLLGLISSKLTDRVFREPSNADKTFSRMVLEIGPPVPFVNGSKRDNQNMTPLQSCCLDAVGFCDDDCRNEVTLETRRMLDIYSGRCEFMSKESFRERRELQMGIERLWMAFAAPIIFRNIRETLCSRLSTADWPRSQTCLQERGLECIFDPISDCLSRYTRADNRRGAAIIVNHNRACKRLCILMRALTKINLFLSERQPTDGDDCLESVSNELEEVTKKLISSLEGAKNSCFPLRVVAFGRDNDDLWTLTQLKGYEKQTKAQTRSKIVHAEIVALVRFIKSFPLKTRSALFPHVETYGKEDWTFKLIMKTPNDGLMMEPFFDWDILFDIVSCLDSWRKAVEHIKPLSTPPVLASVEYLKSFSINSAMFDILILEYDNDNCSFSNSQACPMCITALSKCGIGKQIYSSITCGLETMTINHDPKLHSQSLDDALRESANLCQTLKIGQTLNFEPLALPKLQSDAGGVKEAVVKHEEEVVSLKSVSILK